MFLVYSSVTAGTLTTGQLWVWMLTEVSAGRVSARAGNYQGVAYLLYLVIG